MSFLVNFALLFLGAEGERVFVSVPDGIFRTNAQPAVTAC